jgi:hypothetical protein
MGGFMSAWLMGEKRLGLGRIGLGWQRWPGRGGFGPRIGAIGRETPLGAWEAGPCGREVEITGTKWKFRHGILAVTPSGRASHALSRGLDPLTR